MFWQKKEKGLPQLPPMPRAPSSMPAAMDPEEVEVHGLPKFPDSPMERGFSQSMIKEAVAPKNELPRLPSYGDDDEAETLNVIPEKKYKVVELEEWKPQMPMTKPIPEPPRSMPMVREVERPAPMQMPVPMPRRERMTNEGKSVFVKLDKFYEAKSTLQNIQEKLKDVESLVSKIKEVKSKEDEELAYSERELQTIKARINSVLSEVFENPKT